MDLLPVIAPPRRNSIDVRALSDALSRALSTREVRSDRVSRALYATDASVYQIVPLVVAFPASAADVAAAVRICGEFGVPITARGGGTSQAGQCIGAGVILDCSRHFGRLLEVNAAARWARVEPGCVLDDLNRAVNGHGLKFAPDISTSNRATLGGMIANNSSGARSVLYGKTIDHVQALKVVLSDGSLIHAAPLSEPEIDAKYRQGDLEGACYREVRRLAGEHATEIDRRFPKILRRVGGYNLDAFVPGGANGGAAVPFDLTRLFVGSEGTLGLTVEAKLSMVPLPRARGTLVIEFAGLLDALAAAPAILKHGPAAVEVVDKYVLDSTRLNPEASRLRDFLHGDLERVESRLASLDDEMARRGMGYHRLVVTGGAAQARVWKLRTLALGLSMAEKGDAKAISFVEDTAVAPEHLRDYIAEFLKIVERHGTRAGVYAHASVGCLHVRPVINLKTEEGVRRFEAIAAAVADLVLKYGGALSGEHGDGLVRSPFQEKMYGPVLYQAFRALKQTFDPRGLLNPGKIVDAPPLAANLRQGPVSVTPTVPTTFDFAADGGLLPATELCAGVGECRKRGEGSMCPSFQATREERDSTRGRANVLRMAIKGELGFDGLTDPGVREVLELCLECKACKSECPTNVDMARLKAEALHQYQRAHGTPVRNLAFGHIAFVAGAGSALAPASNWLLASRAVRWFNQAVLGIDGRRPLPRFTRRSLVRQFAELRGTVPTGPPERRILVFPDTFTNYFEPEIGAAAIDFLARRGCSLSLGARDLACCGRPLISNGLLDEAVRHARHNVERLVPWASAGGTITACEPSCILTIKDDYPALLNGPLRDQARVVARACETIEETLLKQMKPAPDAHLRDRAASSSDGSRPSVRQLLVQAHCHERALVGTGPLVALLRLVPDVEVIDLDAGCCGMAGSFGYESEHYDLSRRVGEDRLFPAVRKADSNAVVVAPGFSCRLQIEHFTGRPAVHPAALLSKSLV
jgi:FAD/FMN-containing dehydrogenase/Fe-S oxidoreductase